MTDRIKALEDALRPFADESLHAGPQHGFVTVPVAACDAARAALASSHPARPVAAPHDLEPVAWRRRYTIPAQEGTRIEQWGLSVKQMWPDDLPLYAAPQHLTVQDAARVPEIAALIEDMHAHQRAWRTAITECKTQSDDGSDLADMAYWHDALAAFDRVFAVLRAIAEGRA